MTADPRGPRGSTQRELSQGSPDEEPPPILGSWRRLYTLVLCNLALLIALFYALTVVYR